MHLTLVTPPASAIVTLAEAKTHLRVEHDVENDYIPTLVDAAEALILGREGWTGRASTEQTWKLSLEGFPIDDCIELPFPPLRSVTHVKYYDPDNVQQTFSSAKYAVITDETPGEIELLATQGWPSTYPRHDAVEVQFVCGYDTIPAPIKHATLITLASLYRNRGDESFQMPAAVRRLLAPYKTWCFDDR